MVILMPSQELIERINQMYLDDENPPDSLKNQLRAFCKRKHLFDLLNGIIKLEELSSYTVELIAECFLQNREKWGWMFLCVIIIIVTQSEDPIEWSPESFDFHCLRVVSDFLEKINLPSSEFKECAEYHLRTSVDSLLMSQAFMGCGFKTIEEWSSPRFYKKIIAKSYNFKRDKEYPTVDIVESIVGSVAQLFEKHGLDRLSLKIGGARSYYGNDEKINKAKMNFVRWLIDQGVVPQLFDLFLNGLLIPKNCLLLPNKRKILECAEDDDFEYKGVAGNVDLSKAIFALSFLISDEEPGSVDDYVESFLVGYFHWHDQFQLIENLESYSPAG